MKKTWATSAGVDLHLDLSGSGLRAGLITALREAVRTGRLAPGTRLPSSRSLAGDLGIARNTVAEVYGQLVAEGWLTARQGSGTRVADRLVPDAVRRHDPPPHTAPVAHSLTTGTPDLGSFPRTAWLAAARRALAAAPNEAFGYGDPRGRPELRRALAGYLARARGVRADPERILICSGYAQGLSLLCTALRYQGAATLNVEGLGLPSHWRAAAAAGLRTVPVPVDASGARTDLLGADAALLTPAHQMPMGVSLAPERRAAAVAWAREAGATIVEDDYDGEFRYDRRPVGAVQGLDPEHVVYTGTASKSLAPGLRLAWMVVPDRLMEPVLEAKRLADGFSATLEQLTLAEFITSGAYDRHVRRSRLRYRRRRDRLMTALAERAPRVRLTGIAAGLHVLVVLPGDEPGVVARANAAGLALQGLDWFRYEPDPRGLPALVVGYGTPADHAFSGAVDLLCSIL